MYSDVQPVKIVVEQFANNYTSTPRFWERVELIVSDNCFSDDIKTVVEELSKDYPIKYILNDNNYTSGWSASQLTFC